MLAGKKLLTALTSIIPAAHQGQLSRMVDFFDLTGKGEPQFLYASGRANRFNPPKLECLYLSNTRDTCLLEIDENYPGFEREHPADTTYRVDVNLSRLLDLQLGEVLDAIELPYEELFPPWRRAKKPTTTQMLGKVIALSGQFSSIRFPSNAAHKRQTIGWNVVVFKRALSGSEYVRIHSTDGRHLEQWP
jgi:hypothetical protein